MNAGLLAISLPARTGSPIWPRTRRSANTKDAIVAANTRPAAVTTAPEPAIARIGIGRNIDGEFKAINRNIDNYPPARAFSDYTVTIDRNNLTKAQTMTVAAIEERLPDLVAARDCPSSNDLRRFGLWKNGVSGSVCWLI